MKKVDFGMSTSRGDPNTARRWISEKKTRTPAGPGSSQSSRFMAAKVEATEEILLWLTLAVLGKAAFNPEPQADHSGHFRVLRRAGDP